MHDNVLLAYDMVEWDSIEHILMESGLPMRFIDWTMTTIRTVSYRFNVNGNYIVIIEAKRGIRQGDPISPLLFVLVMEYLTRHLQQLDRILNFNYHTKCEKMKITNLSFADDLLLLSRGNNKSIELMIDTFNKFSKSIGLRVNPSKCHFYFGVMEEGIKEEIMQITWFKEGSLPIRYMGIPLTSKKLDIKHY